VATRCCRVIGWILLVAIVVAQPLVVLLDMQGYHFTARELQLRVFLSSVVLVARRCCSTPACSG
jgi:hypothetical protein